MKKRLLPLLAMQILIFLVMSGFAKQKVLVIADANFYYGSFEYLELLNNYCSDIVNIEHKNAEVFPWITNPGTNVDQCTALLQRLQNEYVEARNEGDVLEGAVLIGDIPVPQYNSGGLYGYLPLDQVYMDIVDRATGNPYIDPPFSNFTPFGIAGNFYSSSFNNGYSGGDWYYDIWISRINAEYMHGIREGLTIYDNHASYVSYLNRVKARMNDPASVPSRGFYMGGPEDHTHNVYDGFGQYLNELHLPWLAEFTGGHHSSFNWMSQLLAGPRGCINYGACNGMLFSMSERNRRFCRYLHLPTVYEYGNTTPTTNLSISAADSLGWEWAGLYNHSCPAHSNFFSDDISGTGIKLNGEFDFGTRGKLWGSAYRIIDTAAHGGSYHYYQDYDTDPNPYNNGFGWKNKGAQWRWRVPPGGAGNYDVYLYYIPRYENCVAVDVGLHVVTVDAMGVPDTVKIDDYSCTINQRTHVDHPLPENNWERLFGGRIGGSTVHLDEGRMVIVGLSLNDGRTGDHIVDAVRFIRTTGGVDDIVDDDQPGNYDEPVDDPSTIFSTPGFRSLDDVFRGFEDMGSEPGGGGFSKTQFFLTNACSINDFIYIWGSTLDKNVGNLYALGYNGLICMGTTISDHEGDDKGPYTRALREGSCFGQAFLSQVNSNFTGRYALLGGGTLRAQPYVQFGSMVLEGFHVGNPRTDTTDRPVLIRNVTASANWVVTSTYNSLTSPVGTHGEIVVRPETSLSPVGSNVIRLSAY